jgi:hypothetical protein
MKYFIDTEFIEGPAKRTIFDRLTFRKPIFTIDLISIGIVDEFGEEFYAISRDFDLKKAWHDHTVEANPEYMPSYGGFHDGAHNPQFIKKYWLRENVLRKIYNELSELWNDYQKHVYKNIGCRDTRNLSFCYKDMKMLIEKYGLHNERIAELVQEFTCRRYARNKFAGGLFKKCWIDDNIVGIKSIHGGTETIDLAHTEFDKPEFYADYCSYDWVVFMWLFGKMVNKPADMPYYCNDLQQMWSAAIDAVYANMPNDRRPYINSDIVILDKEHLSEVTKLLPEYPVNDYEHHALYDARYDKALYEFIQILN